jgi:hypothetical protein
MRKQIVTLAAAGAIGIAGVSLAAPALAAVGADSAPATVDHRVSRNTDALSGLVSGNTLTQDQADAVAQTLADAMPPGGPGGPATHGPGLGDITAAAQSLDMTESDLMTALSGGQTLAEVADDQGVSVDRLVADLEAAATAHLEQGVADGALTQDQADEMASSLTHHVTDLVNGVRPDRGAFGPGHGPGSDLPAPDQAGDTADGPSAA